MQELQQSPVCYWHLSLSGQSWISEGWLHCLLTWLSNYRRISGEQDSQKPGPQETQSYWKEKSSVPKEPLLNDDEWETIKAFAKILKDNPVRAARMMKTE